MRKSIKYHEVTECLHMYTMCYIRASFVYMTMSLARGVQVNIGEIERERGVIYYWTSLSYSYIFCHPWTVHSPSYLNLFPSFYPSHTFLSLSLSLSLSPKSYFDLTLDLSFPLYLSISILSYWATFLSLQFLSMFLSDIY